MTQRTSDTPIKQTMSEANRSLGFIEWMLQYSSHLSTTRKHQPESLAKMAALPKGTIKRKTELCIICGKVPQETVRLDSEMGKKRRLGHLIHKYGEVPVLTGRVICKNCKCRLMTMHNWATELRAKCRKAYCTRLKPTCVSAPASTQQQRRTQLVRILYLSVNYRLTFEKHNASSLSVLKCPKGYSQGCICSVQSFHIIIKFGAYIAVIGKKELVLGHVASFCPPMRSHFKINEVHNLKLEGQVTNAYISKTNFCCLNPFMLSAEKENPLSAG